MSKYEDVVHSETFKHRCHWETPKEVEIIAAGQAGEQNLGSGPSIQGNILRIKEITIRNSGASDTVFILLVKYDGNYDVKLSIDVPANTTRMWESEQGRKFTYGQQPVVPGILQFVDKTAITNPRFQYKIKQGYGFAVGHRFPSVGAGASIDIYFENPSDSGREVVIITVEVTPLAQSDIDIYEGNTVTATGTALTPRNLNRGSSITSVVNAEYGGTYGLGPLIFDDVCPGGSKKQAVGGAAEVGETAVIPPGSNFLVRVTNQSADTTRIAIRILWWEDPI